MRLECLLNVLTWASWFMISSVARELSSGRMLRIMHDVCMVDHASCNSRSDDHETFVSRSKLKGDATVRKTYKGVSAFITARHGENGAYKDWTNYEHWAEACALYAELVTLYAHEVKSRIRNQQHNLTSTRLAYIVLPQIRAAKRNCGLEDSHGIQGLRARGGKYSEVFIALARAAVLPLQQAGVSISSTQNRKDRPHILLCDDVQPRKRNPALEVVCFDSIVEIGPALASHGVIPLDKQSAQADMPKFHHLVGVKLLGMAGDPAISWSLSPLKRVVTLLTRRHGPVWVNREYVKSEIRNAVNQANAKNGRNIYLFKDAGFAEDIGLEKQGGCYRIREQLLLWATSWLMIAPHGAHESNVIFMSKSSGGLVEGLACGHQSDTFTGLARFAQVPYHDAHELDNGDRHGCGTNQGRKYLDKARAINFNHDTMLSVVKSVLSLNTSPLPRNVSTGPKEGLLISKNAASSATTNASTEILAEYSKHFSARRGLLATSGALNIVETLSKTSLTPKNMQSVHKSPQAVKAGNKNKANNDKFSTISIPTEPKQNTKPFSMNNDNSKLAFNSTSRVVNLVHIPKTGGSSAALLIKYVLDVHHPTSISSVNAACATRKGSIKRDEFCAKSPKEALALPPADKCYLLASCGLSHTPSMVLLGTSGVNNIVLLRNPVSRQLSGYFHGLPHSQKTCGHSPRSHQNCETLQAHFLSPYYDNAQTRMLGQGTYPYGSSRSPLTKSDDTAAINNLGRFNVIGIYENFQISMALILEVLLGAFPKKLEDVTRKVTKSRKSCDKGAGGWEVRLTLGFCTKLVFVVIIPTCVSILPGENVPQGCPSEQKCCVCTYERCVSW